MPVSRAENEVIDDQYCERMFQEKHFRDEEGRYVVPIPWKENASCLGDSYNNAVKFYLGQEYRWSQNAEHKQMSDEFMREFLNLGHMSPIPIEEQKDTSGNAYYLPYISILRQDALTTK